MLMKQEKFVENVKRLSPGHYLLTYSNNYIQKILYSMLLRRNLRATFSTCFGRDSMQRHGLQFKGLSCLNAAATRAAVGGEECHRPASMGMCAAENADHDSVSS